MRGFKGGIGAKIFDGFVALILVGLFIGGSGHVSLNGVIDAGNLNEVVKDIQIQILQARRFEKNFLLRKDAESFENLKKTLASLEDLTEKLQSAAGESTSVQEIRTAKQVYAEAVSEMKRLEENDAMLVGRLREVAAEITSIGTAEAETATSQTREAIMRANAEIFKENAVKTVKSVVDLGYSVLKHAHEASLGKDAALETLRSLHFDGSNYVFVAQEGIDGRGLSFPGAIPPQPCLKRSSPLKMTIPVLPSSEL